MTMKMIGNFRGYDIWIGKDAAGVKAYAASNPKAGGPTGPQDFTRRSLRALKSDLGGRVRLPGPGAGHGLPVPEGMREWAKIYREIRPLRAKAGMTQAAFAAEIGIEPNSLARLERGERNPSEPVMRMARIVAEREAAKRM
jgi:DNA-binding XRE family transcriptional regulator